MQDCIFCRILDGREDGSFAYRDSHCAVFADIYPANDGHLLVVPTEHVPHFDGLPPGTAGHLMEVARDMVAALRSSTVRCEGFNIILNDGAVAGQDVFHTHLHIIPRFEGDGFRPRFFPRNAAPHPREGLDRTMEAIRQRPEL